MIIKDNGTRSIITYTIICGCGNPYCSNLNKLPNSIFTRVHDTFRFLETAYIEIYRDLTPTSRW